jgi:hypothetical protein
MPKQTVVAGLVQAKFQRELQFYLDERVVPRLWARDLTLWPAELVERDPALRCQAWLDLPKGLGVFLESVKRNVQAADAEGLFDHAVLSSESVNLCVRALMGIPEIALSRKVVVLDSIWPETIEQNEKQLDLRRTMFLVANKQRYGLRDHCLFLYFLNKTQRIDEARAFRHFVSETESHSYLASVSRGYRFREIVDPPAIPATYFSLAHFSAALTGLGVAVSDQILEAVDQMQSACTSTDPPVSNPALQLAAFLSSAVADHRGYLAILTTSSLNGYARRLKQMLGGSLAREGSALIPVMGFEPRDTPHMEGMAAFVLLTYAGDNSRELDEARSRLQSGGIPYVHIELHQPTDLLTDSFKWEIATVLACARLKVDPFNESDNHVSRAFTEEMLDAISGGQDPLQRSPRITDRLIRLFADGMTRQEMSTLSLVEALRTFLRIGTPGKHLCMLIDMPGTEEVYARFSVLRSVLSSTLKRPVIMAFGPHAGEHTGYFFRDFLPYGPCMVFTTDFNLDKRIPGASYTFGQFHQALALSEYDTMVHWQRPVIRLHLTREFPAALDQLVHVFRRALQRFHS